MRKERIAVLLAIAGLAMFAGGAPLTWWTVVGEHRALGEQHAELAAADVIGVLWPGIGAAAIALLLSLVAGGWLRRIASLTAAFIGGLGVVIAVRGGELGDGAGAVVTIAREQHPQWTSILAVVDHPWPRVLLGLGALLLAAGAGLRASSSAPAPRSGAARTEPADELALWKMQDAGDDPTDRAG